MQQNILPADPPPPHPDPGGGQKVKIKLFQNKSYCISNRGIVNAALCKHIIILSLLTPSTPGVGSKVKTFLLKVVMLHLKLKGMEHRVSCKHIFCTYTHAQPRGWIKR